MKCNLLYFKSSIFHAAKLKLIIRAFEPNTLGVKNQVLKMLILSAGTMVKINKYPMC